MRFHSLNKILFSAFRNEFDIMLYSTAIYRESIVSNHKTQSSVRMNKLWRVKASDVKLQQDTAKREQLRNSMAMI